VTTKPIRTSLYATLIAALDRPQHRIDRGPDHTPGAVAGLGTLLLLERRGWARLQRDHVAGDDGRPAREVTGGWLLPYGLSVLRDEVLRRGDPLPAALATPRRRTADADPFTLVTTGSPRDLPIPF
jgi:hypothetical protein